MDAATNERNLFWVYLVALAAVLLIGIWMARSPAKREAIAMRDQTDGRGHGGDSDDAGAHHHVRARVVRSARSPARCTSTGTGSPSPHEFSVELGLGIFVMLIVGGIESLWGPVLGAAFYVWLPHGLNELDINVFGNPIRQYNQIIYGAVLLLVMIFSPEGLIGIFHRVKAALQHRAIERKQRTWLSDFFGITKPPLVDGARDGRRRRAVARGRRARRAPGRRRRAPPSTDPRCSRRTRSGSASAASGPSTASASTCVKTRSSGWSVRTGAARRRSSTRSSGVVPASGSLEVGGPAGDARDAGSEPGRRCAAHVPGAADVRPPVVHRGRAHLDLGPPVHRHTSRPGSCARSCCGTSVPVGPSPSTRSPASVWATWRSSPRVG